MNRNGLAAALRGRRPTALALAALAAGLISACGGGDPVTTDAAGTDATADFEALTVLADLRGRVDGAISDLESAEGAADVERAGTHLEATATRSIALSRQLGDTSGARAIRRSLTRLTAAARALDEVAGEMADLYERAAVERAPSAESQDQVVELAQELTKLKRRLEAPAGSLQASARFAQRALVAVQGDLASDQVAEVARLKVGFARASREDALEGVEAALMRKASALTEQVAALEPPDVIEDCTSQYYPNVTDLSVRNMDCAEADARTTEAIQALAPSFSIPGWSCSILGDYGPPEGPILGATDIRCESGDRAFRFSFGD